MNFSVFSRDAPASSCSSSTMSDDARRRVRSRSTRGTTAPTITGTSLSRASARASCTRIGSHGPIDPRAGFGSTADKVLLDPYGRAVAVARPATTAGPQPARATMRPSAMKSVVVDPGDYDWEGDVPLHRPFSRTVIYEMHVAGFTRHPSSGRPPTRSAAPTPG